MLREPHDAAAVAGEPGVERARPCVPITRSHTRTLLSSDPLSGAESAPCPAIPPATQQGQRGPSASSRRRSAPEVPRAKASGWPATARWVTVAVAIDVGAIQLVGALPVSRLWGTQVPGPGVSNRLSARFGS